MGKSFLIFARVALWSMALLSSVTANGNEQSLRGFLAAPKTSKTTPLLHDVHNRALQQDPPPDDGPDVDLGEILGISCFSPLATAHVKDVGAVPMADLQVGDHVLTASGTYQPVYTFGHYHPTRTATFVQLFYRYQKEGGDDQEEEEAPLEMSGEHMVFLEGKPHPVRADAVQVGDVLQGIDSMDDSNGLQVQQLQRKQRVVFKVQTVERQGLYAPFTPDGTIVVNNGIVASSYISLQDNTNQVVLQNGWVLFVSQQEYIHRGISPLRLFCMGVSSRFCSTSYNDPEGMPLYNAVGIKVHQWINHQQSSSWVQALVILVIATLTGSCNVVETIFGPTHGPLAIVGVVVVAVQVWWWNNSKRGRNHKQ